MAHFQGEIRSQDILDQMIEDGYRIKFLKDGELLITKPDGTEYNVSLTGQTFNFGCSCPGGQFESDRRDTHVARGDFDPWHWSCKHKKIAMDTCQCSRCGYIQIRYIYEAPNGTNASFFRCKQCAQVSDARDLDMDRKRRAIRIEALSMGLEDIE